MRRAGRALLQSFLTTPALRYLIASGNDVGDHLRLFAQDFKNDPWVQYTVGDLQAIADRDAMVAMVGAAFGGPMRANSRVIEACNRLGWSRYFSDNGGGHPTTHQVSCGRLRA